MFKIIITTAVCIVVAFAAKASIETIIDVSSQISNVSLVDMINK